jgi:anti-sigma regulatory factor (Ser/Thr protein kinase)
MLKSARDLMHTVRRARHAVSASQGTPVFVPWDARPAATEGPSAVKMTVDERDIEGRRMMTSDALPFAAPPAGSAWRPGQPRPLDAGTFALVTLPTSPFWARRYTRCFLDSCRGISDDTASTAELLVCELVTNAVRFASPAAHAVRYPGRAAASLIALSLRHFREGLLIEVYDTDTNPPIRSHPDQHAESGRGLMLVDALSKEWSYFFPPGGGKVVYCVLETT